MARSRSPVGSSRRHRRVGQTREIDVPGPVVDPRIDPTGERSRLRRRLGDCHVVSIVDGAESERSHRGDHATTSRWGLADFVAAEELDRSRGFWWSPDGTRLLVQRTDESPVHTWFVSNPALTRVRPTPQRYPAAGTPNPDGRACGSSTCRRAVSPMSASWRDRVRRDRPLVRARCTSRRGARPSTADRRWHSVDTAARTTELLRTVTDGAWVDVVPGTGCVGPRRTPADRRGARRRLRALCRDGDAVSPADLQVRAVVHRSARRTSRCWHRPTLATNRSGR